MKKIIKSYLIGLIFNIIIVLIASIVVTSLLDSKDLIIGQNYDNYYFIPKAISYLVTSMFVSYKIGERGLLNGMVFCIFTLTFYYLFNILAFNNYNVNLFNCLISILISCLCGSIGVNLRRK